MISRTSSAAVLALAISGLASADTGDMPAAGASWQPSDGDVISFNVLRNGGQFGSHVVRFDESGEGEITATIDVELRAGLGPITVFRYELDATETWRNGKLVSLRGAVNDDGNRGSVTAVRDGDQIAVDGTDYEGRVDGDIVTASHWNIAQIRASQILSTEDGEIINVAVTEQGRDSLTIGGQQVETTRYLMDSDIDVTLWYDDQGRWVKLAFEARGQSIEYVLEEMYS